MQINQEAEVKVNKKATGWWRITLALATAIALGAVDLNKLQPFQNQASAPILSTNNTLVADAVNA